MAKIKNLIGGRVLELDYDYWEFLDFIILDIGYFLKDFQLLNIKILCY